MGIRTQKRRYMEMRCDVTGGEHPRRFNSEELKDQKRNLRTERPEGGNSPRSSGCSSVWFKIILVTQGRSTVRQPVRGHPLRSPSARYRDPRPPSRYDNNYRQFHRPLFQPASQRDIHSFISKIYILLRGASSPTTVKNSVTFIHSFIYYPEALPVQPQ